MKQSKYELSEAFLKKNSLIMKCPFCNADFKVQNHALKCMNNHTINISKKGTVNFITTSNYKESDIYNEKLFNHRRKFIEENMYQELYDKISEIINHELKNRKEISILDLGCGEGLHAQKILEKLHLKYQYYGFDYSKIAISKASTYSSQNHFFFVGDVSKIPVKDNSIDVIMDILSPYNEKEVKRILKDNGLFIKVTPGVDYLKELRQIQGLNEYQNEKIIEENLKRQFSKILKYEVNHTYQSTKNNLKIF